MRWPSPSWAKTAALGAEFSTSFFENVKKPVQSNAPHGLFVFYGTFLNSRVGVRSRAQHRRRLHHRPRQAHRHRRQRHLRQRRQRRHRPPPLPKRGMVPIQRSGVRWRCCAWPGCSWVCARQSGTDCRKAAHPGCRAALQPARCTRLKPTKKHRPRGLRLKLPGRRGGAFFIWLLTRTVPSSCSACTAGPGAGPPR